EGQAAEGLERILPNYLQTQPWFAGKGGVPTSAHIVENIPFEHGEAWIMLVQVDYTVGEAKRFVLPVTFRETTKSAQDAPPPAEFQIASLTITGTEADPRTGVLVDALADKRFAQHLL